MRQVPITITLLLALAISSLAQTPPPDLSGTWIFNTAKSTLAKDNTTKSETIVIDRKKSAIVFHFKADGKKSTETYTPDGQERVAADLSSGQLMSKATWQDSVLIIESTLHIKVPGVVVTVTGLKPVVDKWILASDARTLSHETEDPKETAVYDKK